MSNPGASETVGRMLIAKACEVMLEGAGHVATLRALDEARSLLAGRWSAESIQTFIDTKLS